MRTDPDAQAMQAALEALEYVLPVGIFPGNDGEDAADKARAAIATLRSRLAEGGEEHPSYAIACLLTKSDGRTSTTSATLHIVEAVGGLDSAKGKAVAKALELKPGFAVFDVVAYSEPVYDRPPTHTAAVQAALERAAKVCDGMFHTETRRAGAEAGVAAGNCAAAIRALTPQDVLGGGHG